MKKYVLIFTLTAALNTGFTAKLNGYQDALTSIKNGKLLTFVVHSPDCDNKSEKRDSASVGVLISGIWQPAGILAVGDIIRARGITYSDNLISAPKLGPVKQAYTYDLDKNNQLTIVNKFLDPVTYKEKSPAITLVCQLGTGFEVYN